MGVGPLADRSAEGNADMVGLVGRDPARRDPVRRLLTVVGVLLLLAGVSVLGYVGWQLYGSTWVAQREQERVVTEVERAWSRPDTPARDDAPRSGEQASVPRGVVAILRVPRFGDHYAVPVLRGTDDDTLTRGMGWFPGAAEPGRVGNFALAGHRVTHGEPLRRMPELRAGDEVVVETATHVHTYVLDTAGDALRVTFEEDWVVGRRPRNPDGGVEPPRSAGDRLITLTTCAELFHTDDRLVAFGHLVDSRERSTG